MKTIKIFAYGSLMYEKSLKKTAPNTKIISPVTLHGFVRVFNFPSSYRMSEIDGTPCAVLNLDKSDLNHQLCGVLFETSQENFDEMLKREEGYELVQVEVEDFNNSNTRYKAYTFRSLHYDAHDFQTNSKKQLEYLSWCLEAVKIYGEKFYTNFLETTFIGDKTIQELIEKKELILEI
jgi:cation transport regulator ChaC